MDGVERGRRWRNLKGRLGFKGIGCCGGTWSFRATSDMSVREQNEQRDTQVEETTDVGQIPAENNLDPACVGQVPAVASVMNLATALAAERHFRDAHEWERGDVVGPTSMSAGAGRSVSGTPSKVSLMRLIEEADGVDGEMEKERGGAGSDLVCCVCMGRRKDAAFIPCGHTFCRVCSRELWFNRGCCPLCNRAILEILDIY